MLTPAPALSDAAVVRRLAAYVARHRTAAAAYTALLLADAMLVLAPPYLTRELIDGVLAQPMAPEARRALARVVGLIAAAYLGVHAVRVVIGWISAFLGVAVSRSVREDLFARTVRLPVAYFDARGSGDALTTVTQDAGSLEGFVIEAVQLTLVNLLRVAGIPLILFWMNPRLALVALLPVPFVVWISARMWPRIRHLFTALWERRSELNGAALEALGGIRVVKAQVQESREAQRFETASARYAAARIETDRHSAIKQSATSLLTSAGVLGVWYAGGSAVLAGGATVGELVAFTAYLALFYGPAESLSRLGEWWNQHATVARRIFTLMDASPEFQGEPPRWLPLPRGELRMENVFFAYDPEVPVLRGLTLRVAPGRTVGIVGRSGAGKTTLTGLLLRYHDPVDGTIRVDGVDIHTLHPGTVRGVIGYVGQEPVLFRGTLAENIAYGCPGATRDQVVRAARAAAAHDFIMERKEGYDAPVGERGATLSGGERQRIALARALLCDPPILVLDEPTASLDAETEAAVQRALRELCRGRTTLIVAHRLATLRRADHIVVLRDGVIAESGTHEDLLRLGGEYRRLWGLQNDEPPVRRHDARAVEAVR